MMNYDVRLLSNFKQEGRSYLFDSNIWIKILNPTVPPSQQDERYLSFFKTFTQSNQDSKIIVTALILSEVINRLLREVGMKTYIRSENKQALFEEDSGGFFKKHYRPSEHFTAYYKSIISDFLIYKDFCVFIDDGLSNDVSIDELLTNAQPKLDFNDNYYYLLAKSRNYPIITDDIDFFVPGIEIYTFNMKLYKKGTDSIKPIQKSPLASKKQE